MICNNFKDNQNYFPFSDIVILFLFFISFTIAYFQLFIARKVVYNTAIKTKNHYDVIIIELLIIYSIYTVVLVDIGDNESDMRKSLVSAKSERFSLYTSKINTYNNRNSIYLIVLLVPPKKLSSSFITKSGRSSGIQ